MSCDGIRELVCYSDRVRKFRIGYSLGTVYTENPDNTKKFKLYNFGYCPSTKDFYYNDNLHLSRDLVKHFQSGTESKEELEEEMKNLGLFRKCDVDVLMDEYTASQRHTEIARQKTLNLERTLSRKNQK